MNDRLRRAAPALCVLSLVTAAGCGGSGGDSGGSASSGGGKAPDSVSLRMEQDYDSLDFQVDQRLNSFAISQPAYDRLLSIGPKGSGYVPYLAKSWKVTPTQITFEVRTDAKCGDGHVLTAEDMAASMQRYLTVPKRSGSVATNGLGVGLGPGPWQITAEGPSTLVVKTETPYSNMLSLFAQEGVICPAGLAAVKADEHALEDKTYGSGPYTLVSVAHGKGATYKLRPEWNWGPPGTKSSTMPKQLVYKIVEDQTSTANQLASGELDIGAAAGADLTRLLKDPNLQHITVTNYQSVKLAYNMRPDRPFATTAPGGDALRKAISTAVDPQQWNKAALDGHGEPLTSPFVSKAECYDASTAALMPKPSIDQAKQILTEGGFTYNGDKLMRDGKPVKITVLTAPLMNAGPDYLSGVLRDVGFDVKLENLVGAPYGAKVLAGEFDVAVMQGTRTDPVVGVSISSITGVPGPKGLNSPATGTGNPDYDKTVSEANSTLGGQRCVAFKKVQQMIMQGNYILPLVEADIDVFVRKGLKVPVASPDGTYPVHWITGA